MVIETYVHPVLSRLCKVTAKHTEVQRETECGVESALTERCVKSCRSRKEVHFLFSESRE